MPIKYRVHLFAVVRISVGDVEANSQIEAIDTAKQQTNFHTIFRGDWGHNVQTEWAEEISYYLVDEEGDEEYQKSEYYGPGKEKSHPDMMALVNEVMEASIDVLPTYLGINETVDKIIQLRLRKE